MSRRPPVPAAARPRREGAGAKAARLLAAGRLRVIYADTEWVEARVRGDGAEHVCGYRRGGWYCDCQAHRFGSRCSHVAAAQLIWERPAGRRSA